MNLECLPATEESIPELLGMMSQFYTIDQYPFDVRKTENHIDKFLSEPHLGEIWLASADNRIVGYAILTFVFSFEHSGTIAFLDELFLKEQFRKLGLGSRVLTFLTDRASELGVVRMHLELEKHNTAAKTLYAEHGFVDTNRWLYSKKINS